MLPIRIMTRNFKLLGETSGYESLQITRSWHGIGVMEIRINRYKQHADKFMRGNIIFPHNQLNKAYVVNHREIELDEKGKITENWLIRASSLKAWFAERLTIPPTHTAYDSKMGDAESVMHHYANNNVVTPADPGDKIDDIILAKNQQRGPSVEWQTRYKNLADELVEISYLSELGWNVEIDYENKQYVFKVLEGRDLTAGQSLLPPAKFSPEFGTLKQLAFTDSELDYKNYAIVAGQGEGVERRIVTVGDATGVDRRVLFVDARDIGEETDDNPPQPIPVAQIEESLRNRGLQKLAEHRQEIYLGGQVLTKSRLVYEEDYNLGDLVTLQNKEWGVTADVRITEVKEIYEPSKQLIELTFGNGRPNLFDKIKQDVAQFQSEIKR